MNNDLFRQLEEERIIAILRGLPKDKAADVAGALNAAGVVFAEITLNTEGALEMISKWREGFGDRMRIGAGTVIDLNSAKEAIAAGAEYLVTPNLDEEVIGYALEQGVGVFPGAMTPTEIVRAWKAGATAVKIFPMGSLGIDYFKEIRAPLNSIPMIPTGGVRLGNIQDFFAAGATAVGMGSTIVNLDLVHNSRYEEIITNASALVQAAKSCNK